MAARIFAGVDEAGRGPVLGPLVVACAVTDDPAGLAAAGVRDSKAMSAAARERLEPELKRRLRGFALVVLEPAQIDERRERQSLNAIEGDAFVLAVTQAAKAAGARRLDVLEADAADAHEPNFRAMLVKGLAKHADELRVGRVVAEHKADVRYPAVSAASILAKVERDRRVRDLGVQVGAQIGSGYPHDAVTLRFLREYIKTNGDVPPFARRSWKTSANLLKRAGGRDHSLDQFVREGGQL
jgi:ribonuclease HII